MMKRRNLLKALAAPALTLLPRVGNAGVSHGNSTPPPASPVVLDGTQDNFATYNIFNGTQGPYWINLNLFNVGALEGYTFTATAFPSTFPVATQFAWSWPTPASILYGYPEIVFGTQGGGNFGDGPANQPPPKQINNLGTVSLTYNMTLTTQSVNDTSYLIETWAQTTPGNPATNTVEILFYAFATPAVSSFILAMPVNFNYSVGGFNVYFAFPNSGQVYMMPVTSPGGTTARDMTSGTFTIDFAALITAALNQGWLTGTNYINGYEIGFETREGTGGVTFNQISWNWS
jgi:hypothetical protein